MVRSPALAESDIRDADLRAELAKHPKGFGRDTMIRVLAATQTKRDAENARRASLPRNARRRLETRDLLETSPLDRQDLRHMHSVLGLVGLPYERIPIEVREYGRQQGNMAVDLTAGSLRDDTGQKHLQPIPFGPKARLIMMHLCSEAIRQKSQTIEIADSLTAFVREMGFSDSGGKRGVLTAFKEQLNALAACTMRLSVWEPNRVRTRTISPIEQMDLWLPSHPEQRSLWPSTVTFSAPMYESLKRHAMPLNTHVVRALAGSARKLDLYFWLSWRIHSIDAPLQVSWQALHDQFGGANSRMTSFRYHLAEDIAEIRQVLSKLPVQVNEEGLTLLPAEPGTLALPGKRVTSKKS